MNPGRHKLWWAFWAGVCLVVAALSWASLTVYMLEARNAVDRAENQRQEVVRLALWRMDSRLAPMIALEAARPVDDYQTMIGMDSPRGDGLMGKKKIESGLFNRGFFEIDEVGQAKGSGKRVSEIATLAKDQSSEEINEVSSSFSGTIQTPQPSDSLSGGVFSSVGSVSASVEPEPEADYVARQQIASLAQSNRSMSKAAPAREREESKFDKNELAELFDTDGDGIITDDAVFGFADSFDEVVAEPGIAGSRYSGGAGEESVGAIEPRWVVGDDGHRELVLVRTVERNGLPVVQGVWLDWDAISAELITLIDDLLPLSTLEPIVGEPVVRYQGKGVRLPSYRLATVPVSFIPGGTTDVASDGLTPAMFAMLVTWIAVVLAMVAVGMVLHTVLNLSARRGRFVGAVTHELRTPLTTFRLYSQMLADGMVTDEAVKKEYLNTLKRESDRLTGIVENVLEYARISRQRGVKNKPKGEQRLSVGELMARIVPPMSRLGEQSGMDLIVSDSTCDDAERAVTLDPHAIERIMMNLMDNACKYAGGDTGSDEERDLRVHLDASVERDSLLLVVADHGPGVLSRDRRKIFGEFVRGSTGTMRDRSGLGLGLALSRGLALEMGGDLSLVKRRGHGAEFELRVPLDVERTNQS